jgi:hypothetical protein
MKKEEFRIGNFVEYKGIIATVLEVFNSGGSYLTTIEYEVPLGQKMIKSVEILSDSLKKIPLTKDSLVKFNFIHSEATPNMWFLPEVNFEIYYFEFPSGSLENGFYFNIRHPYDVHVKWVHQLQNLVYSLKDIEL